MRIKDVVSALERFAPLPLQESYDNAGLQVGLTDVKVSGVLLCLDVTEDVVREAIARQCNLVVSHHPLLFGGLKQVGDATQPERCVREAILGDVTLYAAHTNLDNAQGGVNYKIAERLGLQQTDFLVPQGEGGSGLIGTLPADEDPMDFLSRVKTLFGVEMLQYNQGPQRKIRKVALCGGAGSFLLPDAHRAGADVFLTGEMSYHHYFGREQDLWIGVLGHYQSEQFTIDLLSDILRREFPELMICKTKVNTNPIHYL